jgi:hypothetical protein
MENDYSRKMSPGNSASESSRPRTEGRLMLTRETPLGETAFLRLLGPTYPSSKLFSHDIYVYMAKRRRIG